jgi:hypothetical protein
MPVPMRGQIMHHVVSLAALGTGANLKDWALLIGGNVFIIVLVARMIGDFAKRAWGDLIGTIVAAVFVGACVWTPDQMVNVFKQMWTMLNGGTT